MNENLKEGIENHLIAIALIVVYLGLSGVLLWLFAPSPTPWALWSNMALNFGKLWLAVWLARGLGNVVIGFFRLNIYDTFKRLIALNLLVTLPLMSWWAAFAAQFAGSPATNLASTVLLYGLALLSCIMAQTLIVSFTFGSIYQLSTWAIGLIGFVLFAIFKPAIWLGF